VLARCSAWTLSPMLVTTARGPILFQIINRNYINIIYIMLAIVCLSKRPFGALQPPLCCSSKSDLYAIYLRYFSSQRDLDAISIRATHP
jgi:hypothetical protein